MALLIKRAFVTVSNDGGDTWEVQQEVIFGGGRHDVQHASTRDAIWEGKHDRAFDFIITSSIGDLYFASMNYPPTDMHGHINKLNRKRSVNVGI